MNLVWKRRIAGAMWGAGLIVAVLWGGVAGPTVQARGVGYAPPVLVSALEVGQLAEVGVDLHDEVAAGQLVAQLDPGPLTDLREVVSAQLLAAQEAQVNLALTETRRFAQNAEGTMLARANLATSLVEDRAALGAIREQIAIEQDLLDQGATFTQAVLDLERQARVLEARIQAGEEALRIASSAATAAVTRSESAPGANPWEVVWVARQVEALDAQIERLRLTSRIDGRVTAVYRSPGEVVQPGEPVLEIRKLSTDEVVAWLPASASGRIEAGQQARVVRANGEVLSAETVSVGVGLQPLPLSLLYDPQRVEFGVPVRVRLQGAAIDPDEPITLQL